MHKFSFGRETIERYTFGDCWILSNALHSYGFPQVIIDEGYHVANMLPDGKIVDIEGIQSVEEFLKRWEHKKGDLYFGCGDFAGENSWDDNFNEELASHYANRIYRKLVKMKRTFESKTPRFNEFLG